MDKNSVMKNLQKELQLQEKLKKDIYEKRLHLDKSKKQSAMYKKWLKKLERLEVNQIKRKEEIDKKMQDALIRMDEKESCEAQSHATDTDIIEVQSLFDAQGRTCHQK